MPATDVTAGKATACSEAAAMASAKTGMAPASVTATALRPHGHGEKQGERRNEHQATHTSSLYAGVGRAGSILLSLTFDRTAATGASPATSDSLQIQG
jgi:hypothetical protein